ncbi:unnamed protein product [Bursaphelenchus xylophilus]|uniref:(pine wood nematode) hypothetical protein n=1 Tax=Bursaphelenchus xylophilus TaxID=6326 RepID=A0A811M7F8_BURXY|nr:unnamed protein product [Bursaphelenchus xylophilus]CAG9132667.1 unnamed protein product [Bursaphelenchus xylophilus]
MPSATTVRVLLTQSDEDSLGTGCLGSTIIEYSWLLSGWPSTGRSAWLRLTIDGSRRQSAKGYGFVAASLVRALW